MQEQTKRPLTRSQLLNQQAMEGLVKGIAVIIILGVTGFAEVAFLGMIQNMFPNNPIFKAGAIIGAIATGLSVDTLLFAKLKWIRAGYQHWVSWIFFGVEVTVMILNLVISFQLAGGRAPNHLDDWLFAYYQVMPATPIIALIGWTLIFMTDRAKERFELQRDLVEEIEDSELSHKREQHGLLMDLRKRVNHIQAEQMIHEIERRTPDIEFITREVVAREIESLIGIYVPRNKVVESQPPALPGPSLPQNGQLPLPPVAPKEVKAKKTPQPFHNNAHPPAATPEQPAASGPAGSERKPKSLPKYNPYAARRERRQRLRKRKEGEGQSGAASE